MPLKLDWQAIAFDLISFSIKQNLWKGIEESLIHSTKCFVIFSFEQWTRWQTSKGYVKIELTTEVGRMGELKPVETSSVLTEKVHREIVQKNSLNILAKITVIKNVVSHFFLRLLLGYFQPPYYTSTSLCKLKCVIRKAVMYCIKFM